MERNTSYPKKEGVIINQLLEPISIYKLTFDLFLKQDKPADLMGLFLFYYYTAKWQETDYPKCTNIYAAKGLKWGINKLKSVKSDLISLGLIENISSKNTDGQYDGHYIKLNFGIDVTVSQNIVDNKTSGTIIHQVVDSAPNPKELIYNKRKYIKEKVNWIINILPLNLSQDKNLQSKIEEFVTYRFDMNQKRHPFTEAAATMIANKLKKLSKDDTIEAIEFSMRKNYISIYQDNLKSQPNLKPSDIIEASILNENTRKKFNKRYNEALAILSSMDEKDEMELVKNLYALMRWFFKNKTDYAKKNRNLPSSNEFLEDYITWLREQEWLSYVTADLFHPKHKLVKRFLHEYNKQHDLNVLTGK